MIVTSSDFGKPDSLQQTVAAPPMIFAPASPLDRHLKRLSPPVHGGRMDPKKAKRIQKARNLSCSGEFWNNLIDPSKNTEGMILRLRQKHNLAPRGPKHNALRKAILKQRDSLFRYTAS